MGSRTEQVTIYVTEERKTELEQRADDQGDSLSGVINGMIDQQLQQDAQDAIASETRAEERLQELIQVGTEEMTEIAREIRDMNAKFGAYSIANFELMKHDHTDHVRKQALSTGARRIRQDLDAVTDDLAAETASGEDGPADPNTGATQVQNDEPRDSESNAPAEDDSTSTQRETMSAAEAMTGGNTEEHQDGDDEDGDDAETEADSGGLFDRLRSDRE